MELLVMLGFYIFCIDVVRSYANNLEFISKHEFTPGTMFAMMDKIEHKKPIAKPSNLNFAE